jgi:hypothetical protein
MERGDRRRLLIAVTLTITVLGGMFWYIANAPCSGPTKTGTSFFEANSRTDLGDGCTWVCGPSVTVPKPCHTEEHWQLDGPAIVALAAIFSVGLAGVAISVLPALRARRAFAP